MTAQTPVPRPESRTPPISSSTSTPALDIRNLRITYGPTVAVRSCSLSINAGEVHTLIGENGSGKSSLVKVLSGVVQPSGGTVTWAGQPYIARSPRSAQAQGIVTVFQETLVTPDQSVLDNVLLGTDGLLRRSRLTPGSPPAVDRALDAVGLGALDRGTPMSELTIAQRHLVAIARSLTRPWRLLILDEATAALDADDRDRLLKLVRHECRSGRSALFISHRMDELEAVGDHMTILRSGESVETRPIDAGLDRAEVLRLMASTAQEAAASDRAAGRSQVTAAKPARHARHDHPGRGTATSEPVLSTEAVRLEPGDPGIALQVRAGEIVGLAGLDGHGQARFLEVLAGWRRPATGRVTVKSRHGSDVAITGARAAARHGVAYVPGDRKREGLFADRTVLDNLLIADPGDSAKFGFIRRRAAKRRAQQLIDQMRVHPPRSDLTVGRLSGGNQQKVLVGRWVATAPRVLLLNDPMRGVDANAKQDIFEFLARAIANDVAVVLLSTELLELVSVCDRVAVFRNGSVAGEVASEDLTETALLGLMLGEAATALTTTTTDNARQDAHTDHDGATTDAHTGDEQIGRTGEADQEVENARH
jgi:ABC-type sugar transport system ATPase subunit